MAQTVVGMSGVNALLQVSADGSTWTDISGSANQVSATEQTRMSGEAYTFEGDYAVVTAGKREPVELAVRVLYTEEAAESFETVRAYFEATGGTPLYFRYSPKGLATGRLYACEAAVVTRFTYPPIDAADANPVACEIGIRMPAFTVYHGGVPVGEWEDLVTLYDTFTGASWSTKTHWLDDAYAVDDWAGITVASGHVTVIDLDANGFTDGNVPSTWGANLTNLITVDLSDNALLTASVDALVTAFWNARNAFTQPGTIDLGGDNEACTGTVQVPSGAVANCGEMAYELVNDSLTEGFNAWTSVSFA